MVTEDEWPDLSEGDVLVREHADEISPLVVNSIPTRGMFQGKKYLFINAAPLTAQRGHLYHKHAAEESRCIFNDPGWWKAIRLD